MWSVWSETVRLYLGQGMSLLRVGNGQEVVTTHPVTLPMGQVLAKLTETMDQQNFLKKPRQRKLRVTLSGALCPAMTWSAPPDVTRWEELHNIAQASAAVTLGVPVDQVLCEMDINQPQLASAITVPLMQALQGWAQQHRFSLTSVQPLWAMASQSAGSNRSVVRGLVVQEPDSVTLMAEAQKGKYVTATLTGSDDQLSTLTRRWLVSHGVPDEKLQKVRFTAATQTVMPHAPRVWDTHWEKP